VNPAAHGVDASHFVAHFESTQMRPVPQSELYLHVHPAPVHGVEATHLPSMQSKPLAPQSVATVHVFGDGSFGNVGDAQKPARQIVPFAQSASVLHVGRQPSSVQTVPPVHAGSPGTEQGVGVAGVTGVQV